MLDARYNRLLRVWRRKKDIWGMESETKYNTKQLRIVSKQKWKNIIHIYEGGMIVQAENIKIPKKAKLLIRSNQECLIEAIHFKTQLITLKEREKVYNTVSLKNVEFDFSNFDPEEIVTFWRKFEQ